MHSPHKSHHPRTHLTIARTHLTISPPTISLASHLTNPYAHTHLTISHALTIPPTRTQAASTSNPGQGEIIGNDDYARAYDAHYVSW